MATALSPVGSGRADAGSLRRRIPGLVAGCVTALLVLLAGAVYALATPAQWTAQADLLLAPRASTDPASIAGFYETLSRGQLGATAAEILADRRYEEAAARAANVDPDQASWRVGVVPETALVRVEASAPTREAAEALAASLPAEAVGEVNRLLRPYSLTEVGSPRGSAEMTSISPGTLFLVVLLTAVVLGVAVQQLVQQLLRPPPRR